MKIISYILFTPLVWYLSTLLLFNLLSDEEELREKIEKMYSSQVGGTAAVNIGFEEAKKKFLSLLTNPEEEKVGCQKQPRSFHTDLPEGAFCNHCEDPKEEEKE